MTGDVDGIGDRVYPFVHVYATAFTLSEETSLWVGDVQQRVHPIRGIFFFFFSIHT